MRLNTSFIHSSVIPGDGNSLCHSVSVLTCGVPDQTLLFRRSLHSTLKSHMDPNSPLYSRWSQFIMKCCDEFGRDYTNEVKHLIR